MWPVAEPAPKLHVDLRRDYRSSLTGALLIFGLPGVAILAGVFVWRPHLPPVEQGRSLVYALPGALLVLGAGLMARSAAWYPRCSAVFYSCAPVPMRIRAWRSRSGGL